MARFDIASVDANFKGADASGRTDIKFYDVKGEPFSIYGLYKAKTEDGFKRLPDELAKNVNNGVANLYLNTAGGRVRFSTDSDCIVLRVTFSNLTRFSHMTRLGIAGFDLYLDDADTGKSSYYASFVPPTGPLDSYERVVNFPDRKMRYFTLNMPLYNGVDELYLGFCEDAAIGAGLTYRNELPVVFYGSSITQGGCASRPGNCYEAIISRRFDLDYLNLGFSGSGKAEDNIVEYMSKLPMSVFVSDYDHNAPDVEYLGNTHYKMYEKIRKANPTLPYVMISRPDFLKSKESGLKDSHDRRAVIMESYDRARAAGDENVYFIDGESFFLLAGDLRDGCTVDGCHPNDLGMACMAQVIGEALKKILDL